MSYTIVGSCPVCGAPMHVPTIWYGTTPPPVSQTCFCVIPKTYPGNTTITYPPNTTLPEQPSNLPYTHPQSPLPTKNAPIPKSGNEGLDKLFQEMEDCDLMGEPAPDSMHRRIKRLEDAVEDLTELVKELLPEKKEKPTKRKKAGKKKKGKEVLKG